MSEKINLKIESILGGHSPTIFFKSGEGQFISSVGIDPDNTYIPDSFSNRSLGVITPVSYSKFSNTEVNAAPIWIITNPKNAKVYTYLANGKFISYTATLTTETVIGTPTSGAGNGCVYYNNYIYLMTPTDVSRYGPLDGSPSLVNTVWTGATLGSQTALTNTSYPSYVVNYPNHVGYVHTDNTLYFLDYKNGQGLVHKIKTSKVTNEGDTNDGSAYNVLDLPFGYLPTDIKGYGTDLVILAMQTSDATLNQGQSALFFWDTISDSFYQQIPINDAMVTALINKNGQLYIFSGNRNNGFRVSKYIGGYSFIEIDFFEEGHSPFPGAVDSYGERLVLGSKITDPVDALSVFSFGYKNAKLPTNARHSIARPSSTGTNPVITSIKYAQQASGIHPRMLIGWKDDAGSGIDSLGGTPTSIFRSEMFMINRPFVIDNIRIPLSRTITSSTSIGVKIWYDNGTTTKSLNTINNTNYTGLEVVAHYKSQEIEDATTANFQGQSNFFLEFTMNGADENQILLPVEIKVTTFDD